MKRASAGLFMALVAFQLAPVSGSIAGIVIKAGTAIQQPLQDARLELTGSAGTAVVRTDANGRFVFSSLAPGEYRLAVACDGFIRQESAKKIVIGRGQQAGNILFALDPAPTAAGWVLDSYGEPVANMMVEALRRSYDVRGNPRLTRAASATTDDRGEYRIFWLDPGNYFFYAMTAPDAMEAPPMRVFAPTYFPGTNIPDEAKPVRLDVGREIRVDFRLLRRLALWTLTGQTMNALTSRSVGAALTLTPPAEDPSFSRYRAQSSAVGFNPGQFSMINVLPGSYILTARSGSGDGEITAFQRIELPPVPFVPIVRPPAQRVSLALSPPLTINGRLFVESREAPDLREAIVALLSIDPGMRSPRSVPARPDGQFVLNGIVPGSYVVETSNLPQDLYLKAARFGAADILEKPLTLSARETATPLQILLGSDGGRLQVAAYNGRNELHSGAHFVLVPDVPRRSRREQYRLAAAGEDGRAILRGIAPGTYKLFAWEQLEPNAYLNSEYLQAREDFGVPVTVASGDNPPVSARLIPKE